MKSGCNRVNEICFAAEGLSGTAAVSSLRKLGRLMDHAPSGRLFSAIATLADASARAGRTLEDGSRALSGADSAEAAERLSEAVSQLKDLAHRARDTDAPPRRKRQVRR
jgi:hypothetical protein